MRRAAKGTREVLTSSLIFRTPIAVPRIHPSKEIAKEEEAREPRNEQKDHRSDMRDKERQKEKENKERENKEKETKKKEKDVKEIAMRDRDVKEKEKEALGHSTDPFDVHKAQSSVLWHRGDVVFLQSYRDNCQWFTITVKNIVHTSYYSMSIHTTRRWHIPNRSPLSCYFPQFGQRYQNQHHRRTGFPSISPPSSQSCPGASEQKRLRYKITEHKRMTD